MDNMSSELLKIMNAENFQRIMSDDFAFADLIIDARDLDRIINDNKEDTDNGND